MLTSTEKSAGYKDLCGGLESTITFYYIIIYNINYTVSSRKVAPLKSSPPPNLSENAKKFLIPVSLKVNNF